MINYNSVLYDHYPLEFAIKFNYDLVDTISEAHSDTNKRYMNWSRMSEDNFAEYYQNTIINFDKNLRYYLFDCCDKELCLHRYIIITLSLQR